MDIYDDHHEIMRDKNRQQGGEEMNTMDYSNIVPEQANVDSWTFKCFQLVARAVFIGYMANLYSF